MSSMRLIAALAGLCLGAMAWSAAAEELPPDGYITGDWRLPTTPYLWALTGEGDATLTGEAAAGDLGFVDLLGTLDHGVSPDAEAAGVGGYLRLGPWSLDGAAAGTLTMDHSRVTARAIIALLTGITTWYRDSGPLDADEIEEIYWNIVTRMTGIDPDAPTGINQTEIAKALACS